MSGAGVRRRGTVGEEIAAQYVASLGWTIVGRNVRAGRYELDLVCRDGQDIVFVEVKTRWSVPGALPEESMTPRKVLALLAAASTYLQNQVHELVPSRFDFIGVVESDDAFTVSHVRHAVTP